jgi:hypothetical protein
MGLGELPLFAPPKRGIRHQVEYLASVSAAVQVLNTILKEGLHKSPGHVLGGGLIACDH